ncbi:hypothetical protein F0L68_14600 [Solihabitans fulvus]|uniref:DUF5753 domain-containing protein n=1 Tax=Solihabitans fulvus TaxID=1892852 RepID=A0A5B2XF43_9PSEU|nr:DUF5753 domain-containing protein [Solihabitans fulvus]KAA2261933.1 hypothetical protein F0L68_14600 [Solihabitans fulvus]
MRRHQTIHHRYRPTTRVQDQSLARQILSRLENSATAVTTLAQSVIPEPLRTEDYARAELLVHHRERELPDVLARQCRLLTRPGAPAYTAYLDESTLWRKVGGTRILADQLAHLIELSALPTITLRVLPFRIDPYTGMRCPFTLLEPRSGPPSTCVPLLLETLFSELPKDIHEARDTLAVLADRALSPADSLDLIAGRRAALTAAELG